MGFTGYYRKFVENYAKIARPLYDIIIETNTYLKNKRTKNMDIIQLWSEKSNTAFNTLKDNLTTAPILGVPDYTQ